MNVENIQKNKFIYCEEPYSKDILIKEYGVKIGDYISPIFDEDSVLINVTNKGIFVTPSGILNIPCKNLIELNIINNFLEVLNSLEDFKVVSTVEIKSILTEFKNKLINSVEIYNE